MVLEGTTKEAVEAQFKAIYTNKGEVADLNARSTDIVNALSETLGIKKSEVRLTYKQWASQFDDKGDNLDNVTSLLEMLGVGNE